jgi:hypothetical protein
MNSQVKSEIPQLDPFLSRTKEKRDKDPTALVEPKEVQFIFNISEPVQDDDGFFSNLFVKWKSNPVFGKKQDESSNDMSDQPDNTDDSQDLSDHDKTQDQLRAINNQGQL